MSNPVIISNLSFNYLGRGGWLFESVNLTLHPGWTAFAGANGSGKSTLADLIAGVLAADSGTIRHSGQVCLCTQVFGGIEVDDYQYLYDYSSDSVRLRRLLALDEEMFERAGTLSGGERKRLQLYLALSRSPSVLILDEPTNHLDARSKNIILSALYGYDGVGILISHDRAFMDSLARRTIIFSCEGEDRPVQLDDIPLPASAAFSEREERRASILSRRAALAGNLASLGRAESGLEERIRASSSRMSKRGIDARDHDAKGKIDAARLTGKDRRDGDRKKALESRMDDVRKRLDSLGEVRLRKSGLSAPSFSSLHSALHIPPTDIAAGSYTLHVAMMDFPPASRTRIDGDNGAGKTLLVKHLVTAARERWGDDAVAYIRQEYSPDDEALICSRYYELDDAGRGSVVSDLYRLGSDPASFLSGNGISPGELRKLDFLLSVRSAPALLVMDEPTNHLDITSVMALEQMLSSSGLTLILVSHDAAFSTRLCDRTVEVVRNGSTGEARLC